MAVGGWRLALLAATPPEACRHRARLALGNRVNPHVSGPDLPLVEPVDRRDLTVPGSVVDSRTMFIAAPPDQVGGVIGLGRLPPGLPVPGEPQERQERRHIPRIPTGCSTPPRPSWRTGKRRSTGRRTRTPARSKTASGQVRRPRPATDPTRRAARTRTAAAPSARATRPERSAPANRS